MYMHSGGQRKQVLALEERAKQPTSPFRNLVGFAGLASLLLGGACLAIAYAGMWSGVHGLRDRIGRDRKEMWVVTCPVTDEPSLLLIDDGQIVECSLQGIFCGERCRKTQTDSNADSNPFRLLESR
jgi:hypothetical protein